MQTTARASEAKKPLGTMSELWVYISDNSNLISFSQVSSADTWLTAAEVRELSFARLAFFGPR
jgi:hypothetical protein